MRTLLRAAVVAVLAGTAWGQTITYQGQLKSGSTAATGVFDMRFTVMNAASGGLQVDQVCVDNVQVSGGLFTVQLPFAQTTAALLAGSDLHLAIEVRPDAGAACGSGGGYAALSPRQALTSVPKAQVAEFALNFEGGEPVYAELKRAAGFVVPNTGGVAAGAAIPFDTVIGNTGGAAMFDAAQPTRIGVPQSGRYLVNVRLGAGASSATAYGVRLRRNGDTNLANEIVLGGGSTALATVSTVGGSRPDNFTTVATLNAGEFFEVWVTVHSSSGTVNGGPGALTEATVNVQLLNAGPRGPVGPQGVPGAPGPTYVAGSGLSLSGATFSIPAGGVGAAQIAPGAVGSSQLGAGAVASGQLAADAASLARVSNGVMTATPTGRIGIGDAAPGAALSVVGGSESVAALEVFGSGGADIQLRSGPPTDTVGAGAFLIEGGDGSSIASAATGRSGGTVNILAGTGSAGTATNGRGGGVVLTSGRGRGSPVSAVAGAAGGVANMIAGAGGDSSTIGGDGGEVVIEGGAGGNGGSQDGEGGGIFLFAGAGSPEGNVYLDGGFVKSQSPLGVNVDPVRALHVQPAVNGSGGAPSSNTHFVFEHNSTAYIGVLTPDASEKGIAFGSPASAVHGGVYYSNAGGMSLRTGGNNTGVVIDSAGNVGVGVDPAGTRFHVRGTSPVRMVLSPSASDTNTELLFSENTTLSNGIKLQMDGSSNALSVTDVTGGAESNIAAFDRDGNAFSAGVKAFRIDHPLDPMNRELWHSCVESPDMLNVYSGNVTTGGDGLATVELPPYFSALNRDFRYQLTVIDEGDEPEVFVWAKVIRKVADNRFTVRTSRPGVEVSWQVTGVRKDALAEKHRLVVERDKPAERKGTYLHPEAFEKNGGER